jgi:hypothetical protein
MHFGRGGLPGGEKKHVQHNGSIWRFYFAKQSMAAKKVWRLGIGKILMVLCQIKSSSSFILMSKLFWEQLFLLLATVKILFEIEFFVANT